jgi:ABC-2 type transport system permease protein
MAVYRQTYTPYEGELTPKRWRFWVIPRFAFKQVFQSKPVLILMVLSFVPMLGGGSIIYLRNNLDALLALGISVDGFLEINEGFFGTLMGIQSSLAFFLTVLVGPGLVSPDLTNGALPLYLSRPFSRAEYTLGKFAVIASMASVITWVPGLILWTMHGSMAGNGWFGDNLRIAAAIFAGSWAWIVTIALMAIAFSAWVRWRPVAGVLLFAVFFVGAGVGEMFNEIVNTNWGTLVNLSVVIAGMWQWLFTGRVLPGAYPLPAWTICLSLGTVWAVSLFLLHRKVRAFEVVR